MNKKAGIFGNIISLIVLIVFIYVCYKYPEILKEAGLWAWGGVKLVWSFVIEKING